MGLSLVEPGWLASEPSEAAKRQQQQHLKQVESVNAVAGCSEGGGQPFIQTHRAFRRADLQGP